jgi:ribosomal protein S18 acetylase RimI-like enzyme
MGNDAQITFAGNHATAADINIHAAEGNEQTLGFYERNGFRKRYTFMHLYNPR